jgi:GR25 family glycosyltransferase involved in LPS biosynthesis
MINYFVKSFYKTHSVLDALNCVRICRCSELYSLGVIFGSYFSKQFPYNPDIRDETGICAFYSKDYKKSANIYSELLTLQNLSEDSSKKYKFNSHFSDEYIQEQYCYYNQEIIDKIKNTTKKNKPIVTLSITTCKRFDLFEKTMNSFLNTCKDIHKIDKWLCVDDNSSQEDIEKMKQLYPFFNFYFKTIEEKGHPQSMNIIKKLVTTPYLFHMEDDWLFFKSENYITNCLEVLGQGDDIKQCLINNNYAEKSEDFDIKGGLYNVTQTGLRYYLHEFCDNQNQKDIFIKNYGHSKNCNYWPHFSFRPSLLKTSIFDTIGEFNIDISHFEMDYSYKYANNGYKSAFLENIYCTHIGRLTSERNDITKINAYTLNNEAQFHGKEDICHKNSIQQKNNLHPTIKSWVINLERRPDRLDNFLNKYPGINNLLNIHKAVDGSILVSTPQLQKIFDGNNYNMREGLVGCAMSHIELYIKLVSSNDTDAFIIMEDDISFVDDFYQKLSTIIKQSTKVNWDMIYLGHHLYKNHQLDDPYNKTNSPTIEKWSTQQSLSKSMGGTGGYIISKQGAEKLLTFINKFGMTNGIDTVQQKAADTLNIYYCHPHLIYSECFMGDNNPDTDIQHNYNSLSVPITDRIQTEIDTHNGMKKLNTLIETTKYIQNINSTEIAYYHSTPEEIDILLHNITITHYTLNNSVLIIIPKPTTETYILSDRLKISGNWNIQNTLVYKHNNII